MADWNINIDNITCNAAVLKLEKPSDNTNEFPDSFRLEVDSAQYTFPLNSNDIENPDNMSVLTQDLTFYPTLDSTSGSYTAQVSRKKRSDRTVLRSILCYVLKFFTSVLLGLSS